MGALFQLEPNAAPVVAQARPGRTRDAAIQVNRNRNTAMGSVAVRVG
jgi:hypothetical protein